MNRFFIRLIIDLIILWCVMQGWWFVALPIALVYTWIFGLYLEIIVAGLFHDSLYGMVPDMGVWGYAGTITTTTIFIVVNMLKKVVRK